MMRRFGIALGIVWAVWIVFLFSFAFSINWLRFFARHVHVDFIRPVWLLLILTTIVYGFAAAVGAIRRAFRRDNESAN